MNSQENDKNFYSYSKQVLDFDEVTFLTPNNFGSKEDGEISETSLEFKNKYDKFCKDNSIPEKVLFLGAVSLALNKFNYSHSSLIFKCAINS